MRNNLKETVTRLLRSKVRQVENVEVRRSRARQIQEATKEAFDADQPTRNEQGNAL